MTTKPTRRPNYRRNNELPFYSDATKTDLACDYAAATFHRLADDMDLKWGIDRLPTLVPPELAGRYGAALGHLNECIAANDPDATAAASANLARALVKLDQVATESGATPASGEYWEYELEGYHCAIVKDISGWKRIKDARPGLVIHSLREVVLALKAYRTEFPAVDAIKEHFPGSQTTKLERKRTPLEEELNDEIPW